MQITHDIWVLFLKLRLTSFQSLMCTRWRSKTNEVRGGVTVFTTNTVWVKQNVNFFQQNGSVIKTEQN
jgi:hypothetical protein